jgi:copper chaperone CopZ
MSRWMSLLALGLLVACDADLAAPPEGASTGGVPSAPTAAPSAAPASGQRVLRLRVDDLTCEGCAWQIRETLQPLPGVSDVQTDIEAKEVAVTFDPASSGRDAFLAALATAGYRSVVVLTE